MEVVYSYQIPNMEVVEGDVVSVVHYRVVASTDELDIHPVYSSVVKLDSPGEEFIEFNQLNKEQVIDWVKNKIDTFAIEESLRTQLQEIKDSISLTSSPISKIPAGWV